MKTISKTYQTYSFSGLSDKAKEKALEGLRWYNVEGLDWWDATFEDAERIGLKIDSFDLDQNKHCEGQLTIDPVDVAKLIAKEHGKVSETYRIAKKFLADLPKDEEKAGEINSLEGAFHNDLANEYSCILQREYDYLTSNEAIEEVIASNEYVFLKDGKEFTE